MEAVYVDYFYVLLLEPTYIYGDTVQVMFFFCFFYFSELQAKAINYD